jgi:hypothetical protein
LQIRPHADDLNLAPREGQLVSCATRVLGEAMAMAPGVGIAALDRLGESQRRIEGEMGQALLLPHAADRQLCLAGQSL